MYSTRSSRIKTHRLPSFAPGNRPDLARRRTSSACILRKLAASVSESVLIAHWFINIIKPETSFYIAFFGYLP